MGKGGAVEGGLLVLLLLLFLLLLLLVFLLLFLLLLIFFFLLLSPVFFFPPPSPPSLPQKYGLHSSQIGLVSRGPFYRVVFFDWSALKMTKCQTLRKF